MDDDCTGDLRHVPGSCIEPGVDHSVVVVYDRPLRRLFRRRYMLRCWHCDMQITEPVR